MRAMNAGSSHLAQVDAEAFVATGEAPAPDQVRAWIDGAHARYRDVTLGENSSVYPALAAVPPELFGICAISPRAEHAVGDADFEFSIMSVSKPFVFALVCDALGPDRTHALLGANATGLPFNSLDAVQRSADGRTNPMVNSGAITSTSFVPGGTPGEKWQAILRVLSSFAGRDLTLNQEVYDSAMQTNRRNREIARMLEERGRLGCPAADAVELYTRQCALNVTARDLAAMGATLANGGVNPLTGDRVVDATVCHYTLAVMCTAGLYETSGDWLYDVGLPGKSGIGGGIVTVSPGKGGLGTFSPRLDSAGNSVRGQLAARFLSRRLGFDLFASTPLTPLLRDHTQP